MSYPNIIAFQVSPSSTETKSVPRLPEVRYTKADAAKSVASQRLYGKPLLDRAVEDSKKAFFDAKVREWLADTKWQSSMSIITSHPAFDEIKGLGDSAVRLILERMARGSVFLHWFPLLHALAGIDPVQPHERGFVPQMTAAWLRWGQQTGRV